MREDQGSGQERETLPRPSLQSRLAAPSATTSSSSSSSLPALVEAHSPAPGASLVLRISNAPPGTPAPLRLITPTPYYNCVGFHSLLPILAYENKELTPVPGSFLPNDAGDIDYIADLLYVLILRCDDGWTTSLVKGAYFLLPAVQQCLANRIPIPLSDILLGGRDGVLIAGHDPTSQKRVDELLTDPKRHAHASKYIERAGFTPPELRDYIHEYALDCWPDIKAARDRERKAQGIMRSEPPPTAHPAIWKRWLREMRTHAEQEGTTFTYVGIPYVCETYQKAHLNGAKAILSSLPPMAKGAPNRGPLRHAFSCVAAALLCVPGRYKQVLEGLGQQIIQGKQFHYYDTRRFGDENHTSITEVARYFALIGVTVEKAEQWRAWAAAYVDMEIDESPNSRYTSLLQEARALSHEHIRQDPSLVLKNVNKSSPGYYQPEHEPMTPRAMLHGAPHEAGPSAIAVDADPAVLFDYTDDVEDAISLDYNEDDLMGPG